MLSDRDENHLGVRVARTHPGRPSQGGARRIRAYVGPTLGERATKRDQANPRVPGDQGAQYSARWGFGVDFVPKVRGGRPSWKRTAKSADFDVTIDPIDDAGSVPRWCSIVATDSGRHVDAVARDVWSKASQDFSRVVAVADLFDVM